jgi:hypothetical protein
MFRDHIVAHAEPYLIRGRSIARTTVQVVGILAVLVGAFNYLLAPALTTGPVLTVYRDVAFSVLAFNIASAADIGLMVVGAIVAWLG